MRYPIASIAAGFAWRIVAIALAVLGITALWLPWALNHENPPELPEWEMEIPND